MKILTKDVLGFQPKFDYYIDERGDVYSTYSQKYLTPEKTRNGYLRVQIGEKHYLVHRLVAMTFLGIMPKGYEVNHKDQNTENNNLDNLEWVTHKENINYAPTRKARIAAMPKGEAHMFSKLTEKEVLQIIELSDRYSNSELANMFNVDRKSIYNIKAHKTWKYLFE